MVIVARDRQVPHPAVMDGRDRTPRPRLRSGRPRS
jgi:hypothetical protein